MELTNLESLWEQIKKLPPKTPIYVGGTKGYLHIIKDDNGNDFIVFDDCEEIDN